MALERYFEWADQLPWREYAAWGNSAIRWLVAAGVALLAMFLLRIVVGFVQRRIQRITAATTAAWDDGIAEAMQATKAWFLLMVAICSPP